VARTSGNRARARSGGRLRRTDPLTSLVLIFPLFLIYELAIPFIPSAYNGADLVTSQIVRLLHGQLGVYIALNGALFLLFIVVVLLLRRQHRFDAALVAPLLIESGLYALTMGTLICFVMVDLLHIDPRLALPPLRAGAPSPGVLASVIIAIGAGVHEELVFRVGLFGGLDLLCGRVMGLSRLWSIAIALVVSATLFSAAHHVIGGEPFRVGAFVYRLLCGVFFAGLYQLRGLSVAVYTHTLYDVYVFLLG
jgi:membrane protease YdiL (CAAX protease family)